MKKELSDFKQYIDNATNIAIFWHNNPDGDCLWSCFSLWTILKRLWKNVRYFANRSVSQMYDFLWDENVFETWFNGWDFDLIIMCDFFDPNGRFLDYKVRDKSYYSKIPQIVIDHHIRETIYGDLYIWWDFYSSTCEIMFGLIEELWPDLIDSKIATYLMIWIITDTWNFVFDCTSANTLSVASSLLKYWAEHQTIINKLFFNNTFDFIKFQALLLWRIKVEWKLLYTYFFVKEMKDHWLDEDQTKQVLYTLQSIGEIDTILFFKFRENWLSCSVRSKYDIANKIAWNFGWWGHAKASWFEIMWNDLWVVDMERIIDRVKEFQKRIEN